MAIKNLTLKIQGQGYGWGQSLKSQLGSNILSTHILLVPCQSTLLFLWYSFFLNLNFKIQGQGHKVGITPYWLISLSFHVDRPSHSWDTVISKSDAENTKSRSWVRSKLKVTTWIPVMPDLTSFGPMSKPIWGKWQNNYDLAQRQVYTNPWNFKWGKFIQWFQRYAFCKDWTQSVTNLTSFWPIWGKWTHDHDSAQLQA